MGKLFDTFEDALEHMFFLKNTSIGERLFEIRAEGFQYKLVEVARN
jgi:hypothetical protein